MTRPPVRIIPGFRSPLFVKEKADISSYIDPLREGKFISSIGFDIDGLGAVITTGIKGYRPIPFNAYIIEASIIADQSGSIVVDIWSDSYANYPPTNADSITGATPPTLSAAIKNTDTALVDWTRKIPKGKCLGYNVDSASTVKWVSVILKVFRD